MGYQRVYKRGDEGLLDISAVFQLVAVNSFCRQPWACLHSLQRDSYVKASIANAGLTLWVQTFICPCMGERA